MNFVTSNEGHRIQPLLDEYNSIFEGDEKLQNFQLKLHIDHNKPPIKQPPHRFPHNNRPITAKAERDGQERYKRKG